MKKKEIGTKKMKTIDMVNGFEPVITLDIGNELTSQDILSMMVLHMMNHGNVGNKHVTYFNTKRCRIIVTDNLMASKTKSITVTPCIYHGIVDGTKMFHKMERMTKTFELDLLDGATSCFEELSRYAKEIDRYFPTIDEDFSVIELIAYLATVHRDLYLDRNHNDGPYKKEHTVELNGKQFSISYQINNMIDIETKQKTYTVQIKSDYFEEDPRDIDISVSYDEGSMKDSLIYRSRITYQLRRALRTTNIDDIKNKR